MSVSSREHALERRRLALQRRPSVVAPSIGDGAAGSAVIRKKCSQPSAAWKPAYPSLPIGSSAVPSKQK